MKTKFKKILFSVGMSLAAVGFIGTTSIAHADHNHGVTSRRDFRQALDNIYRADTYIVQHRYGRAEDEIYSAIDHLENDGGREARRAIRYLNLTLDYMGYDDEKARDYLNEAETICEENS